MLGYFNPYSDQTFFGFFVTLFKRLMQLLPSSNERLMSDEIQILVLMGVAASSALVGTFLVLRKMTMLANALSHTILIGIFLAFFVMWSIAGKNEPFQSLSIPLLLLAACITGMLTTCLTEFLSKVVRLQEDASIGLVFSLLFAAGVVLITVFAKNVHIGTELVMGNVDALTKSDILPVMVTLLLNCSFFLCFFKGFKISTFDPGLAKALSFSPGFYNYLLMLLASATAISAFKAVGVLMVLAFIVMPTMTARRLTHSLIPLIFISILIGVSASLIGVALSRHILTVSGIGLSTAGIVVLLLGLFYVGATLYTQLRVKIAFKFAKYSLER